MITQHTRILEIGCNRGYLLDALRSFSDRIYGIDIDTAVLQRPVHHDCITCGCDAQDIAFAAESFDLVIALHTIEHIPDLTKAIQEFSRILKNKGTLMIVYPFEPIIGITCLPGISLSKKCNVHVHKLNPKLLLKVINTCNIALHVVDSWLYYGLLPNYITVLEKRL